MTSKKNQFPPGFDETKIKIIIEHYENQTEEAVAEDKSIIAN